MIDRATRYLTSRRRTAFGALLVAASAGRVWRGRKRAHGPAGRSRQGLLTRRLSTQRTNHVRVIPVTVTFTVLLPSGKPLTQYKTGPGPHTGVHLIIVRDDLAYIIHQHPPIGPNGLLRQTVTFPAPGPYKVLVDVYPNIPGGQPNFQLFRTVDVSGAYHPLPLPPFKSDLVVDGYHFDMKPHSQIHAIQAQFVNVEVTDAHGHKPTFVPWFGALAHAIFFRQGHARLLPHPHLRAERTELRRAARRRVIADLRQLDRARQAHDRRAAARAGHVAAVPADEARRPDRDRAIHAAGRLMRPAGIRLRLFAAIVALGAGVAAVIIAIVLVQSALG